MQENKGSFSLVKNTPQSVEQQLYENASFGMTQQLLHEVERAVSASEQQISVLNGICSV